MPRTSTESGNQGPRLAATILAYVFLDPDPAEATLDGAPVVEISEEDSSKFWKETTVPLVCFPKIEPSRRSLFVSESFARQGRDVAHLYSLNLSDCSVTHERVSREHCASYSFCQAFSPGSTSFTLCMNGNILPR